MLRTWRRKWFKRREFMIVTEKMFSCPSECFYDETENESKVTEELKVLSELETCWGDDRDLGQCRTCHISAESNSQINAINFLLIIPEYSSTDRCISKISNIMASTWITLWLNISRLNTNNWYVAKLVCELINVNEKIPPLGFRLSEEAACRFGIPWRWARFLSGEVWMWRHMLKIESGEWGFVNVKECLKWNEACKSLKSLQELRDPWMSLNFEVASKSLLWRYKKNLKGLNDLEELVRASRACKSLKLLKSWRDSLAEWLPITAIMSYDSGRWKLLWRRDNEGLDEQRGQGNCQSSCNYHEHPLLTDELNGNWKLINSPQWAIKIKLTWL